MALRQITAAVNDGGGGMLKLSIDDLRAAKTEFDNYIYNLKVNSLDKMYNTLFQFKTNVNKNVWAGPDADLIREIIESQMETIHKNSLSFSYLKQDVDKAIDDLIAWMSSNGFTNINNEYYNEIMTTRRKAVENKNYYNGLIKKINSQYSSGNNFINSIRKWWNFDTDKINAYQSYVNSAQATIDECDRKIKLINQLPTQDQEVANIIINSTYLERAGLTITN